MQFVNKRSRRPRNLELVKIPSNGCVLKHRTGLSKKLFLRMPTRNMVEDQLPGTRLAREQGRGAGTNMPIRSRKITIHLAVGGFGDNGVGI